MEFNDAQLAFLRARGKTFAELTDPADKLQVANLSTPAPKQGAAQAAAPAAEPDPAANYTEAQAAYFKNLKDLKGVKSEADLSEEEADMLAFWGTVGRDKKDAEDAAKAEAEKPLALMEPSEGKMEGLDPSARIDVVNAHSVIKQAYADKIAGRYPSVSDDRLSRAVLRCKKYLS